MTFVPFPVTRKWLQKKNMRNDYTDVALVTQRLLKLCLIPRLSLASNHPIYHRIFHEH